MKDKERKQTWRVGCTGPRLCHITPPKRQICVKSSDLRDMADGRIHFFLNLRFHCMYMAWIKLHEIKVRSTEIRICQVLVPIYFVQYYVHLCNMADILPIRRKTLSNQSINLCNNNKKRGVGFRRSWYYTQWIKFIARV